MASRSVECMKMTKELGAKDTAAHDAAFSYADRRVILRAAATNNIVRVTLQALSAVMGGTPFAYQRFDEALALPTEEAARIALRTQQIIAHESGAIDSVDPFAGSYMVETLTDEIETKAWEYIQRIDAMGGSVQAIEAGFMQNEMRHLRTRINPNSVGRENY